MAMELPARHDGSGVVRQVRRRWKRSTDADTRWFHAANSVARLQEAIAIIADQLASGGAAHPLDPSGDGETSSTVSVYGIEVDVEWHGNLETSVLSHDPIALPETLSVDGLEGRDDDNHHLHRHRLPCCKRMVEDRVGEAPVFCTLESFFEYLVEAAALWSWLRGPPLVTATEREDSALSHAAPRRRLIVKLDFKAVPAAEHFVAAAAAKSWAGLERLLDASSAVDPAERSVELWWNADVVPQVGVEQTYKYGFTRVPSPQLWTLLSQTAAAIGGRVALGFSLGWVLRPLPDPPRPYLLSYTSEDARLMSRFLDGLATTLAQQQQQRGSTAPPLVHLLTVPLPLDALFPPTATARREYAFSNRMPAAAQSLHCATAVLLSGRRCLAAANQTALSTGANDTVSCFPTFWRRPNTYGAYDDDAFFLATAMAKKIFPHCTIDSGN